MSASLYDRVSYDELGGLMKLLFSGLNSNEGTTSNNQHSQRLRRLTQLEQAHLRRLASRPAAMRMLITRSLSCGKATRSRPTSPLPS